MVTRATTLGLVFLIGCAVGGASSQLVAPPARAGTNPTRWEYRCLDENESMETNYNKLGAQGWEMATATTTKLGTLGGEAGYIYCFKRER